MSHASFAPAPGCPDRCSAIVRAPRRAGRWALWLLVFLFPRLACPVALADETSGKLASEEVEFFETRIRPVLVEHCYECHSASTPELRGGLRVDSRDGLLRGGDSGTALVPGKPEQSLLLAALRHEGLEMPPDRKLPAGVLADFQRWIARGAADPRDRQPTADEAAGQAWQVKLRRRADWWSLQRPRTVAPPETDDAAWNEEPVDRFIREGLDKAGLRPAGPADAVTLLRRLSFVLTGLPPTPAEVKRFSTRCAADPEAALRRLVDRLLASPQFGERFARHWMDVVRYTDTYGYEWDNPAKGSWEYRDYLIRAFNQDIGFDQLIREQLAGDLLDSPRIDPRQGLNESLIGPMFYHMGEHRHGDSLDFNGIHQEMVNNKIDAFSKAFLASTVACARCHDHKRDAISQRDYYALAGVFMTPRWTARIIDAPGSQERRIESLVKLRAEIRQALARRWQQEQPRRGGQQLRSWARSRPAMPLPPWEDPARLLIRLAAAADGASADESTSDQSSAAGSESAGAESAGAGAGRVQAGSADAEVVRVWRELAAEWRAAHEQRKAANGQRFQVLSDFREPGLPEGWVVEGDGLRYGYVSDGSPRVALEGTKLIEQLLPTGYHTHALSSKLPGALRLPAQDQLQGQFLSLQLAGGEWAAWLVVPENAFQTESIFFLDSPQPAWKALADRPLGTGVTRVLFELATAPLNPGFPPRTGKARAGQTTLPAQDDGYDKRSWFSLTGIVRHDAAGSPADTLELYASLFQGEPPATSDQAWQRIAAWFEDSLRQWQAGRPTPHDVRRINWLLSQGFLANERAEAAEVAERVEQYRRLEQQIAFPRTANSMDERGVRPVDYRLNVRGDVDQEGEAVRRDFLEVFTQQCSLAEQAGSGRRELAEFLASPENPQTARVYVNRVWYWLFGQGLVATPNDFGKLGEAPSHPELLDWLAVRFMDEGWSTKRLVRRLVLSRTFRQAGQVDPQAGQRDPTNRLWHHYPTRRLEAESIRDALLAVSGRLDNRLYGRPINPPRVAEDAMKRLFSGPLDSHGRRSLYLEMSIMEPPRFLVGFNLPDLKLPTGRRDVTNVPAQALLLLNDPLVLQLAGQWADHVLGDGRADPAERMRAMFLQALGREPADEELRRWTAAAREFATGGPSPPDAQLMRDRSAWAAIAHALFNTSEFIHYR